MNFFLACEESKSYFMPQFSPLSCILYEFFVMFFDIRLSDTAKGKILVDFSDVILCKVFHTNCF